ncbi:universal stress protein [Bradyrhizobium sp.]|uniref:universal stress protein n=1 Tax=Bradyrhizobium sp. TaxID=376 RepID=UPI003C7944DC
MSYAMLMVYVNVDHVSKQLVSVAAGLADKFSAKLIGVSALAIVPPFVAEGVVIVDNASEFQIAQMKTKLAEAGDNFRSAAGAGRQTEWRSALEIPTDTLITEARCADLVVIERNRRSIDFYKVPDCGAAILGAGRPVLVVPGAVKSLTADHVVVGWRDTREARRAIWDALPFLHQAKRVTVIEICENDQKEAARHHVDDVVLYLARHRVMAEGRVETQLLGSGADQIIQLAEDEGADLLVTGAYGHSRLNEWIFGGITHDLLTSSPICCLMSH